MNLIGSIKDCFWVEKSTTRLGVSNQKLWFDAIEDSTVVKLLKEENWFYKISNCTPFCVGVLDLYTKQKSGIYAGASSSGSTVDVESDRVDFSIATDTGGSTVAPSARANLYGFKPSYGRISRYGLNPLCSSLDTVSIIARDLSIIKRVYSKLDVMDPKDQTSASISEREVPSTKIKLKIAKNLFCSRSLEQLMKLHPDAELVDFPIPKEVIEGAYFYTLCPDFYSNLAKFNGIYHHFKDHLMVLDYNMNKIIECRSSLNSQIKSRLMLGAELLSSNVYDYENISKFKKILERILKDYYWIFPVSADGSLYSNDLKYTSYCIISNFLGRPSITTPSDNKNMIDEGYFITAPRHHDIQLLNFISINQAL